jgi:hypothetical protein
VEKTHVRYIHVLGGSLILFQPPVLGSSGFIKLQNKITSGFGVLKISKEQAKFPQRTHSKLMV